MFWLLMRVDRSTWADCKYTQTICEISLDLYQCNVLKASDMSNMALSYTILSSRNHLITSKYRFIFFCGNVIRFLTNYLKLASRLWNSYAGTVFLLHEPHSIWVLHFNPMKFTIRIFKTNGTRWHLVSVID